MTDIALTIRDATIRSLVAPMRRPLHTRVSSIDRSALVLLDLHTEEGVTGRSYLIGYSESGNAMLAVALRYAVTAVSGDRIAPMEIFAKATKSLTLMGHQGIAAIAIAGLDMACWDALARAADVPLVTLLGGSPRPIPAYNSNGLGLIEPAAAADEAEVLVAEGGFRAVKVRVGRSTLAEDLAVIRAVRGRVGDDVLLPVDFNQGLTVMEAIRRGQALDGEGVYWIEEPTLYDDLAGHARISAEVATPIQIGENFYGPRAMAEALTAKACDYVMPDVERIGGVTGWLRAAALASVAGVEMSSHLMPEVSCHLMGVTPTAHWLEYVDWANPILQTPLTIEDGHALISTRPGIGLDWREDAVAEFEVDL